MNGHAGKDGSTLIQARKDFAKVVVINWTPGWAAFYAGDAGKLRVTQAVHNNPYVEFDIVKAGLTSADDLNATLNAFDTQAAQNPSDVASVSKRHGQIVYGADR